MCSSPIYRLLGAAAVLIATAAFVGCDTAEIEEPVTCADLNGTYEAQSLRIEAFNDDGTFVEAQIDATFERVAP